MPRYNHSIKSPSYYEHEYVDEEGATIGTLRVKPSGLLWKGRYKRKFLSVSLEEFIDWIEDEGTEAAEITR